MITGCCLIGSENTLSWTRSGRFLKNAIKQREKQFHNRLVFGGRVVLFEFLRSLCLSFSVSLSPCLSFLPSSLPLTHASQLASHHVFNAQHHQHQIAQHQPCESAFLLSGPLPSRPLLFHSDVRRKDMCCNLSNFLADSCSHFTSK